MTLTENMIESIRGGTWTRAPLATGRLDHRSDRRLLHVGRQHFAWSVRDDGFTRPVRRGDFLNRPADTPSATPHARAPCNYPHLSTPNQRLAGFVQIVSICAELFE